MSTEPNTAGLRPPWPPGVSGNPSGRKPLPEWMRADATSDELLRIQFQAATTGRIPLAPAGDDDEPEVTDDGEVIPPSRTQVVPAKTRLAAAEALLNRIHGKPPIVIDAVQVSPAESKLTRLYEAADELARIEAQAAARKPDG